MHKDGRIDLDKREIQSLHDKYREQKQQNQQNQDSSQRANQLCSQLVRPQIFPREFVPFCVNEYSKQSTMKLYPVDRVNLDHQLLGSRITLLYEAINSFKQPAQKQKLHHMFRLEEIHRLVEEINNDQQSQENTLFVPYLEEGQVLYKVDTNKFKHQENSSAIPYNDRLRIVKDFQLVLKVFEKLTKHKQFHSVALTTHSFLLLQYPKYGLENHQYEIKLQSSQIFNFLLKSQSDKTKQFDVIDNARKILSMLLGISLKESERSQLDQHHYEQISYLLNLHDIIKINYQNFYKIKKSNNNNEKQSQPTSDQQQLQKLKQQILSLQQLAKTQLKDFKLSPNPQPKLSQTTKQNNKQFWSSIQRYILSNVTESERSIILNPVQKKQQSQVTAKRPQRKPSATNVKKQTKPEPKQVSKIEQPKQQQKVNTAKSNQFKQLIVQANYIASGSDLKFRPQLLQQSIQHKQSILYILKTRNKTSPQYTTYISCFVNAKPSKQSFNLFGSYSPDPSKKSFIYSQKTDRFYKLMDKSYAVGYGPEVFFSIGKLDIIVPCFGTDYLEGKEMLKCVSYFPLSYSAKGIEMNGMEKIQDEDQDTKVNNMREGKQNQLGLDREFLLEDVDIYEIKLKGQ